MSGKTIVLLFVTAAVIAGLGDLAHTLQGVLFYPESIFPKVPYQPIWVFLVFGLAGVGLGLSSFYLKHVLQLEVSEVKLTQVASTAALFLAQYIVSAWVSFYGSWVSHLTLGAFAVASYLLIYGRRVTPLGFLLPSAFLGAGVEAALSASGAFFYGPLHVDLLGIPSWLPWLYVSAGIAAATLIQWISSTRN